MWCIPPEQDAAFVAAMEQVLEVYKRPYDPKRPVVCMDEQSKQLISEIATPIEAQPGKPARIDYEYVREGVCCVWMFTEPLGGWRNVSVTSRRTACDWAEQILALVDEPRYQDIEKITLVCDNLNTHNIASLYQKFEPQEALRIAQKIELVHTPKHGSWLNIAECELSVISRQALKERIRTLEKVQQKAKAWQNKRNQKQIGVEWHFTTDEARIKLKRLYPKIKL